MAMPTRLPVLLQRWKSAFADAGVSANAAATSKSRTDVGTAKGKALYLLLGRYRVKA
jgi:hypothetical protein